MKVCFFGTYMAGYTRNSTLRQGLQRRGVEVVEVNYDISNIRLELPGDATLFSFLYRILRKIKAYLTLILRFREVISADYIFVLHPGHLDLPLAWILARIGSKKLYFDSSISPFDIMFVGRSIGKRGSVKERVIKMAEKFFLLLPDKILVDTEPMKKFLSEEFRLAGEKIVVVPTGANDEIYKPNGNTKQNGKTGVLFFGLYNLMHGAHYIMEAIKLLKEERNINFTMLGDGYLKKDFMEFAKINKITNINFIGFVPENKLVEKVQQADILLGVFSDSKVFERVIPNKVFAAIACRKALITARYRILEQYFQDRKNIYLTEKNDADSLASAIKLLADKRDLQEKLAEEGYRIYLKNFTPDVIGRVLYQELMS